MQSIEQPKPAQQVAFYSAIATAVMTVVTFGFAITAIPISGPGCVAGCIDYPYLNSVAQYPRDYIWMYLALLMLACYTVFMVALNATTAPERKIFSQVGLAFALMAALVLIVTYFTQAAVVPVSLMHGETEGITLFTQYNAHGIFIASEEIGYLLMSLSFLFFGLALGARGPSAARWIFIAAFVLSIAALAGMTAAYGLDRADRFEIAVISITWLTLIVNGILMGAAFWRELRPEVKAGLT